MRAVVRYEAALFGLADLPVPEPTMDGWCLLRVALGGICGSDSRALAGHRPLGPVTPDGDPVVLGHEIVGTVVGTGRRVLVHPLITCTTMGQPQCAACERGFDGQCSRYWSPDPRPGKALGMTGGLGGGWAEYALAHTAMLHSIPDHLSWRTAVLGEPLSVAIGGLRRLSPDGPVVVVGGGPLGLLTAWAATQLFTASVTLVVRHDRQAALARALLSRVVQEPDAVDQIGTAPVRYADEPMLLDGPPFVVDAAGTPAALRLAFRLAGRGGTVLTLGNPDRCDDLRLLWLKRLTLLAHLEQSTDDLAEALRLLGSDGKDLGDLLVSHTFPLDGYAEALRVGQPKMKVVLQP